MERHELNTIIEHECTENGFNFRVVESQHLATQSPALPVALLYQPEFISQQGRITGRRTYAIKLLLLISSSIAPTPEDRAEYIGQLETSALQMLTNISFDERVALIKDIHIEATDSRHLGRREFGIEIKAKVVTLF